MKNTLAVEDKSAVEDKIKTIVLDKVNYRGTQP